MPARVAVSASPPLRRQALAAAVAVAAALAAVLAPLSLPAAAAALALFAGAVALAGRGLTAHHPHARFGAANAVTLVRAGVASGMVLALTDAPRVAGQPALAWGLAAAAAATLALDGVDGWLARRSGLASPFGARFDMETDAALALMLALGLAATGRAGLWVLALGGMRYLFVAAAAFLPWLAAPLPPRQSRRTVCVVQIGALVALTAPVLSPPVSTAIGLAATAALAWSFAVDVVWLWRRR